MVSLPQSSATDVKSTWLLAVSTVNKAALPTVYNVFAINIESYSLIKSITLLGCCEPKTSIEGIHVFNAT